MSNPTKDAFPYLDQLLGGYFHWDWELDDDTIEEVVKRFTGANDSCEIWATIADIRRFLRYNPDADAAYSRIFPNELLPAGWGLTAKEWLEWLERLMIEHIPKNLA